MCLASLRASLRPIAYDPHAEPNNAAARLIAILESGKTGEAALTALEDATKAGADRP